MNAVLTPRKKKLLQTFAARLNNELQRAKMDPVDLARASGLDEMAISRMRRGTNEPLLSAAVSVARALDVSLDSLCDDED